MIATEAPFGGTPGWVPFRELLGRPCTPSCLSALHIATSFVSTQHGSIKTRGRPSGIETESHPPGYGEFLPWQKISAGSAKIPVGFLSLLVLSESSDNYVSATDFNYYILNVV